jgi:hypothetical protein
MGKRGKSSFLFIVHDCVGEHGEQRNNYRGFKWHCFSCFHVMGNK